MCERSKRKIKAKEEGRIRLIAAGKPPGARDNPQPPSANIPTSGSNNVGDDGCVMISRAVLLATLIKGRSSDSEGTEMAYA